MALSLRTDVQSLGQPHPSLTWGNTSIPVNVKPAPRDCPPNTHNTETQACACTLYCVHTHTCISPQMHRGVYPHMHTHRDMHTDAQVHVHTRLTHTYTQMHRCVYTHTLIHTHMYIHADAQVHVHTWLTHAHTHRRTGACTRMAHTHRCTGACTQTPHCFPVYHSCSPRPSRLWHTSSHWLWSPETALLCALSLQHLKSFTVPATAVTPTASLLSCHCL